MKSLDKIFRKNLNPWLFLRPNHNYLILNLISIFIDQRIRNKIFIISTISGTIEYKIRNDYGYYRQNIIK
jgi:hypothetical protein